LCAAARVTEGDTLLYAERLDKAVWVCGNTRVVAKAARMDFPPRP
jgi:hypothetical protein